MEKDMTVRQTIDQFHEKVESLLDQGWKPYNGILYWRNAVTQVMILGDEDLAVLGPFLAREQRFGSPIPKELEHCIGGAPIPPRTKPWHDTI
jgi:hypothetical protein